MNKRFRVLCAAVLVVLFTMLTGTASMQAQPCAAITFINNCPPPIGVTMCAWGTPSPPCIGVPAGATVILPLPAPILIKGLFGASGTAYPWQPAPVPPPVLIPPLTVPSPLWIPSIELGTVPLPNRCFDVYWDPATCTATIYPAGFTPCIHP